MLPGNVPIGAHLGEREQPLLPQQSLRLAKSKKKRKPVVLNPINASSTTAPSDTLLANLVMHVVSGQTLHANNTQRGVQIHEKNHKTTIFDKLSTGTISRSQGRPLQLRSMEDFTGNGTLTRTHSMSMTSNFEFDSSEKATKKRRPGSTGAAPVTVADLAPLHMFPDKHDTLSGAFFATDKRVSPSLLEEEAGLQFKKVPKPIDPGHVDGAINGIPLQFDVSLAEKHSDWYRWKNGDVSSKVAPPRASKNFLLVEESKLQNLTAFEIKMSKEAKDVGFMHDGVLISSHLDTGLDVKSAHEETSSIHVPGSRAAINAYDERKDSKERRVGTHSRESDTPPPLGDKISLRSLIRTRSDSEELEGSDAEEWSANVDTRISRAQDLMPPGKHANVLNHTMLDPRVPTPQIAAALKSLADNQMRILLKDWNALQANWSDHIKKHHYNRAYLFREYTQDKVVNATHEREGSQEWLLKYAPLEDRAKKLKAAETALKGFLRRHDRDCMLYEDDRSFLYNKMFEARDRSVDYERYVFLSKLFGPMSVEDWDKCGARPGLSYWVKATAAALKIQHKWDQYWSTYKLHRYRAARVVQTVWRKHYCLINITPLIRIRLKFGKRTYYYFCWASWRRYNYMVRNIARLLHFHKYNWQRQCMNAWKQFLAYRRAEKQEILKKFRNRFDVRAGTFHRMKAFTKRSQYLKCMLRNMYYIPQFLMWKNATQLSLRAKKLGLVVTPVQAFVRMKIQKARFARIQKSKRIMVRICRLLRAMAVLRKKRERHIDVRLQEWKPAELVRRAEEKDEIERRRQLREIQLAEEKCSPAITEMQKHFKSWSTNGATQIQDELALHKAGMNLGCIKADPSITTAAHMEYNLLLRCYMANYEEQKFEYRVKKPPYIVCADPLCAKIFSSSESYIEHIESMMKNANKCQRGILKKDVQLNIAERGLKKLGIEPVQTKKKKLKKLAAEANTSAVATGTAPAAPTESIDQGAVAPVGPPPKSAADKLREKRQKEKEAAEAKLKAQQDAAAEEERLKKEKRKLKKQASKMSARQKRKAGLTDEDEVETETAEQTAERLASEAAAAEQKRLKEEEEALQAKAEEQRLLAELAAEEEKAAKAKAAQEELEAIEKANSAPIHVGIRKHMVFPDYNFARFHIVLKHKDGCQALKAYLTRKHGLSPIVNTLDCWDAIQMWRMASIYSQNDAYIQRALSIYEVFLRADCARPVMINIADGNILNNHYAKIASIAAMAAQLSKKKTLKMMVKKQQNLSKLATEKEEDQANKDEGLTDLDWWDTMIDRLLEVKNREYIGYFGLKKAEKSWFRSMFGLRHKTYQSWNECRTVNTDCFDALEWACFQMLYRVVFSYDKMTPEDIAIENELERLQLEKDKKEQKLRDELEAKADKKWDTKWIRWAREACVLSALKQGRSMRELQRQTDEINALVLGDAYSPDENEADLYHSEDESAWLPGDPKYEIREQAISDSCGHVVAAFANSSQLADYVINIILQKLIQDEHCACGEPPGDGGYTPPPLYQILPSQAVNSEGLQDKDAELGTSVGFGIVQTQKPLAKDGDRAEYDAINLFEIPFIAVVIKQYNLTRKLPPVGKSRASIRVNAKAAAWQIEKESAYAPFLRSREYSVYDRVVKSEQVRAAAAFRDDCKASRLKSIAEWAHGCKLLENDISVVAMATANKVMEAQIDRLYSRAAAVSVPSAVSRLREKEQAPHEEKLLLNDDAVAWTEENMLDHVFDHYVTALLNTMLGMEECREGVLEYGGFLKGQKKLQKKLEIKLEDVGRRVDDSWFKNMLKTAIADDLKHMPLDYIGCVKLIQRRFRGMRGRNIGRRLFAKYWLKKFDAGENRVYYVNGKTDPPSVQWERPKFMLHLFPKTSW